MVKKSRKLPYTPNSQIKSALRKLWLWSRERNATLRRDKYTCQKCNQKQSRSKGKEFYVEVHHEDGIDWDGLCDLIRQRLLQSPEKLKTLCKTCHEETAIK